MPANAPSAPPINNPRQGNWGGYGEELKKTGEILLTLEKKGGKAK